MILHLIAYIWFQKILYAFSQSTFQHENNTHVFKDAAGTQNSKICSKVILELENEGETKFMLISQPRKTTLKAKHIAQKW